MLRPVLAGAVPVDTGAPGPTRLQPDPRSQAHPNQQEKQVLRRNSPALLHRSPAVLCAVLPAGFWEDFWVPCFSLAWRKPAGAGLAEAASAFLRSSLLRASDISSTASFVVPHSRPVMARRNIEIPQITSPIVRHSERSLRLMSPIFGPF